MSGVTIVFAEDVVVALFVAAVLLAEVGFLLVGGLAVQGVYYRYGGDGVEAPLWPNALLGYTFLGFVLYGFASMFLLMFSAASLLRDLGVSP